MNGRGRVTKTVAHKGLIWLVIAAVHLGSFAPWQLVYAVEVEKKEVSSKTNVQSEQESVDHIVSAPEDFTQTQAEIDARIAERVERFQMAQATEPPVISPAREIMDNAREADANDNHVAAALLSLDVTNRFSGTAEAAEALRLLTDYSSRLHTGEFPKEHISAFEAGLPTYAQAASIDSRYVLIAFWTNAAQYANRHGPGSDTRRLSEKALQYSKEFMSSYPNNYLSLYASNYAFTAADILGESQKGEAIEWLQSYTETQPASIARCGARAILAMHYGVTQNSMAAAAQRRRLLADWEVSNAAAILNDAKVPGESKAYILMHLGLAQRSVNDFEGALASFEIVTDLLPYAGYSTEASALYAVQVRYQLVPEDHATAIAGYHEFLTTYPQSRLLPDAQLNMAGAYMAANDYDQAYAIYEALQRSSLRDKASRTAQTNMDYIIKRELTIANAGEETASVFAMACGPMALHSLFAELGFQSSVPQLIRHANTNSEGTTMSNLIAAANDFGMSLNGVRARSLDEMAGPFIAFVRGNHYVMVRSYDADSVIIRDMNRPVERVPRIKFESEWSGEVLCTQGAYRVAESLPQFELDSLTGGVIPACLPDENGDVNEACEVNTLVDPTPEQDPFAGKPGGPECSNGGCTGNSPTAVGGNSSSPSRACPWCVDPWLTGPGMPRSGLHQVGGYIDVGIPDNVGTVSVNPLLAETRIDRTDMVVASIGAIEFRLTKSYANIRGGVRTWRDRCLTTSNGCCWEIDGEMECDLTACNEREYRTTSHSTYVHRWGSSLEMYLSQSIDDDVYISASWMGTREFVDVDQQGTWKIYRPSDGGTDMEVWYSQTTSQWLLKREDGFVWDLTGGAVNWVEDQYGNRMTFDYNIVANTTTISFPSPDTRTVVVSLSGTKVELKDSSGVVLRTVQYSSGTESGEPYDNVLYDGVESIRYYYKNGIFNTGDGEKPENENSTGCATLPRRDDIYDINYVSKIKDRRQIVSGNGAYTFEYSPANSPGGPTQLTVTLPSGLSTEITRSLDSGFNATEAIVGIDGRSALYKHDTNHRLSERLFFNYDVTPYGDWEKWSYVYNTSGQLTTVHAPGPTSNTTQVWARYAYDTKGRISTIMRGPGTTAPTWEWQYTTGYPFPTKYIDATDVETTWTYLSSKPGVLEKYKPPVARNSTNGFVFTRNSDGEITRVTDPQGKYWDYDYDAWGNLDFAETPLNEAVEMEWNALGQLKKVWDPMDKRTEFEYIVGTSCSTCGPPGLLKNVKRFYTSGGTEYHRLTTFDYDDNGNLEFVTDPGGETVAYAYDTMNQVTSIKFPYGVSGEKTTGVNWKPFGLINSITDAESNQTLFGYDHAYRPSLFNDPLTSPAGNTLLTYTRFGKLKTVEDSKGQTWTYTYSDKQWLTDITDELNKNLHYVHDDAGRVTQVSAGTGVGNGGTYPIAYDYEIGSTGRGVLERVDYGASSAGGWASFGYNHLGAVTSMDDSLKSLFSMPDLLYTYDDAGRLDTLTDWNGTLDYDYNAAGAVTDFTDWEGNVTHYGYNDLHELTALSFLYGSANEENWSFAYNAAGQPDSYTHPNGMTTDYVYDSNGILTDIEHKDGSTVKQGFSYDEYDDVYNIKKVTHEDGSYWTYGYDDRYRLTSAVRHNAGDTIQANYTYAYDAGDNMSSKTEPWADDFADGSTSGDWSTSGTWSASTKAAKNTSSASGAGLYKTVNDDDVEYRFTYAIESSTAAIPYVDVNFRYNTASTERMLLRFRLDQAELRYHNGSGWAATHTNTGVDSTAGVKYAVRVEVSGANVRVWRRLASGGAETLIYSRTDAPTYNGDRLRFNAAVDTVISLDDVMILASDSGLSRTTTMTYRANNEIDTAADYNGTASYTFDAWGRMSTESKNSVTRTYSWTSANLLAGINSSDSAETDVTYAYTGDLKRGWRLENGSLANYYTWDAGFSIIGEEAVGLPRKTFVPGLAEVVGNDLDTSATYNYLTTDHLGSTRGMWNNSIAQTGSWEYTPYGSPFNFAGPPDVTQLYTGHDLDRATGQYYAPFRHLNAGLGRWVSQDPLGMVDGTNVFGYVRASPIRFTDGLGLESWLSGVLCSWLGWGCPEKPAQEQGADTAQEACETTVPGVAVPEPTPEKAVPNEQPEVKTKAPRKSPVGDLPGPHIPKRIGGVLDPSGSLYDTAVAAPEVFPGAVDVYTERLTWEEAIDGAMEQNPTVHPNRHPAHRRNGGFDWQKNPRNR